jgi:uncharacterized membrane protein (Fun14 family)
MKQPAKTPRRSMSPLEKAGLVAIALVLVLSVAARAFGSSPGGQGDPSAPAGVEGSKVGPQGFLPGQPGAGTPGTGEAAEPEGLAKALPYLTEGSFFALIGFALGYASRKFVKIGLIFLAIFFVGLQVLAYGEVVEIDWGRGIELVNRLVLNIQEGEPIQKILLDKLPTAGGLVAGYLLGFRKG